MKLTDFQRSLIGMALLCPLFGSLPASAYTLQVEETDGSLWGTHTDGNRFRFDLHQEWIEAEDRYEWTSSTVNDMVVNDFDVELPEKIKIVSTSNEETLNREIDVVGIDVWTPYYGEMSLSYLVPASYKNVFVHNQSINKITFEGMTPPSFDSDYEAIMIVPSAAIAEYRRYCNENINGWKSDIIIIPDNYKTASAVTLSVVAGSLESSLEAELSRLGKTFEDVYALNVSGTLNGRDLNVFASLRYLNCLDLSSASGFESMRGCTGLRLLEEVVLPSSVKVIEQDAFKNCTSLTSINLARVEEIGNLAFHNCRRLESVAGNYVRIVRGDAFHSCSSLASFDFPNLTQIDGGAFAYTDLKEFRIYENISYSGNILYGSKVEKLYIESNRNYRDFADMPKLTDVYVYDPIPATDVNINEGDTRIPRLHVPGFSFEEYVDNPKYYCFKEVLRLDEDLTGVNVYEDLTIGSNGSLSGKFNLALTNGDLQNNASGALSIGDFIQEYHTYYDSYWEGDHYIHIPINPLTTLINNGSMTADNVKVVIEMNEGWNFISLPFDVNVKDIVTPSEALWVVREYDSEIRAKRSATGDNAQSQSAWVNVNENSMLKAGKGYILHFSSKNGNKFTFPAANSTRNNIFNSSDVNLALDVYPSEFAQDASWNFVGNPYPACFDIQDLSYDAPITVWQSGARTYQALSLTDDDYILAPFEGFFVQATGSDSAMTFAKEGRSNEFGQSSARRNSPRKMAASNPDRAIINLSVSGNGATDRTRLVINEEASTAYEISCDASKFLSSDETVPQIFMLENGERLSIDERPMEEGIFRIGTVFGVAGEYTINSNSRNSDYSVMLYDAETGTETDITDNAYSFMADKGASSARFSIRLAAAENAVNEIDSDKCGLTFNAGHLSVSAKGEIFVYSIDGKVVAGGVDTLDVELPNGVFVVKAAGKAMKVTY